MINDQEPTTNSQRPTTGNFSIIGKPIAMVDAAGKSTGSGKYADDLTLPGMLIGKILHSPYPHAIIKSIDTTRAEKLDGVGIQPNCDGDCEVDLHYGATPETWLCRLMSTLVSAALAAMMIRPNRKIIAL